jgi:hypothetical protein
MGYVSSGFNLQRPTARRARRTRAQARASGNAPSARRTVTPRGGARSSPGGCQIGYVCDQNSTYGLHSLPGVSDWVRVRPELDLWVALTPGGCQIGYMCDQNSTSGLHSLPGVVRLGTCATRTRLMGCTHLPGGVRLVIWTGCHPLAVMSYWLLSTGILTAE